MSDESSAEPAEALPKDLQQLSALLLQAEPAFVLDLQGRIADANAAVQTNYGWDREDLLGRAFSELVPSQWHHQIENLLSQCLAGQTIRHVESARQNRLGQVNPVSLTLTRVTDASGKPTAVALYAEDISELKLIETRLHRMSMVFMDAADPIIIRDLEGRIIDVNDEVQRTFGWTREELIGKLALTALPPEWEAVFHDVVDRCVRGEALRNMEFDVPNKAGETINVLATLSLLNDGSGNPLGIAQIIKNITELKRTAHELERSNRELEQFAAVVAHDLQQPLSTVKGYYDLLQRHHQEEFSEEASGFLQSIGNGIKQAQSLVGELLSYAVLDRQERSITTVRCEDAFNQARASLQSAVDASRAVITCHDLPAVECDGSQLVQLFENLLGNAIKYCGSEQPRVDVSAERKDDGWVFCVADNGIGIDPAHQEQVFDIFTRLHPRDKYPGTGIGLAICRKIVERHGGRIWVESQLDEGSRFCFKLPIRQTATTSD